MSKLTSLDAAAAGQREGDRDVMFNLADAREEIEKARFFLARAGAPGSARH